MKIQASSAIENGLTSQLMASVTPMPRACCATSPMRAKSIFSSIGMIMSQISTATTRFTSAICRWLMAWNTPGISLPRLMPTTMQPNTHHVRLRSKKLIFAAGALICSRRLCVK